MGSKGRCNVNESKLGTGFPTNVKSTSKEVLEATLKKKRESDVKALKIVEQLLEADVTEQAFLDCLPFIHDSHFQDAVEERALTKLCGYPPCSSRLKQFLVQRYHISTKLNKVYDITERKNFCSNQCYKSARFVKDQLLTSPLWLRDKEQIPSFTLLPRFALGGIVGDEVDIGEVPSLKDEVEKHKHGDKTLLVIAKSVSTSTQTKDERRRVEPIEAEPEVDGRSQETTTKVCVVAKTETIPHLHQAVSRGLWPRSVPKEENRGRAEEVSEISDRVPMSEDEIYIQNCQMLVGASLNQTSANQTETLEDVAESEPTSNQSKAGDNLQHSENTSKKEDKSKAPASLPRSSVARVEVCLAEWFTVESLCVLLGEDTVREMVSNLGKSLKDQYQPVGARSWDPSTRESYQNICRRLNLMELEDARYDDRVTSEGQALKPLPDYSVVKEESVKLQLKVRAFYGGKTCYENVLAGKDGAESSGAEEKTSYLPLVDTHAKRALRRRIVLDRFNRVIPGLMLVLELSSQEATSEVRTIVSTFALEAHNITFKPAEWNLLGLALLKMISLKNSKIKLALESEKARNYTATILTVFGKRDRYLDGLIGQLTDVNNVLGRRTELSGSDR